MNRKELSAIYLEQELRCRIGKSMISGRTVYDWNHHEYTFDTYWAAFKFFCEINEIPE